MGYRAESLTVNFFLRKENFKEVEVRFQKLMDSQVTVERSPYSVNWSEWLYGKSSYYEGESKNFVVDDIFNTFGFEYEEDDKGNIDHIVYPEYSFNSDKINGFLSLFNGLVDEGCFIDTGFTLYAPPKVDVENFGETTYMEDPELLDEINKLFRTSFVMSDFDGR